VIVNPGFRDKVIREIRVKICAAARFQHHRLIHLLARPAHVPVDEDGRSIGVRNTFSLLEDAESTGEVSGRVVWEDDREISEPGLLETLELVLNCTKGD